MKRANRIIKVSPVDVALDAMTHEELFRLLGAIPGVSAPALSRADEGALRNAARTYLRIGRLQPEAVLQFKRATGVRPATRATRVRPATRVTEVRPATRAKMG